MEREGGGADSVVRSNGAANPQSRNSHTDEYWLRQIPQYMELRHYGLVLREQRTATSAGAVLFQLEVRPSETRGRSLQVCTGTTSKRERDPTDSNHPQATGPNVTPYAEQRKRLPN